MEKLYITSLQNPQVKAWRALKDAKARAEQGLFLAEGDHLTGNGFHPPQPADGRAEFLKIGPAFEDQRIDLRLKVARVLSRIG